MSRPSKTIRPDRGWRKPKIVLSDVDFPAPLGPMIPVTVPRATPSVRPFRMSMPSTYPATTRSSSSSATLAPQVGFEHHGVVGDFFEGSLGNELALVHHRNPAAEPAQRRHLVRDDEERHALRAIHPENRLHDRVLDRRVHAGEGLIHREQANREHHQAARERQENAPP